jgi:hypothetical protein
MAWRKKSGNGRIVPWGRGPAGNTFANIRQVFEGTVLPFALPACHAGPLDRDTALAMFTALRELALARGAALRAPPAEPDSCCGRGCHGCVWESYYAAAACWQEDALSRMGPGGGLLDLACHLHDHP